MSMWPKSRNILFTSPGIHNIITFNQWLWPWHMTFYQPLKSKAIFSLLVHRKRKIQSMSPYVCTFIHTVALIYDLLTSNRITSLIFSLYHFLSFLSHTRSISEIWVTVAWSGLGCSIPNSKVPGSILDPDIKPKTFNIGRLTVPSQSAQH